MKKMKISDIYERVTIIEDNTNEFIYETRANAIYSDGCYYCLLHRKSGIKWIFDKDKTVLSNLIDFLSTNGAVNSNGLNPKSKGMISQILWKFYHPHDNRQVGKMLFADGNSQNLTSANLYIRGDCVSSNQNRRIWHNENRIFIKLPAINALFFTDYEPELFDLVRCTDFNSWYLKDSHSSTGYRLMACYDKVRINLAEIVYGYYYFGLRAGNIVKVLPRLKKQLAPKGLEIDHLRNNPQNNTIHNLILMPKKLNSRKGNLVVKINAPFWCIPVQKDGKIRMSIGDASMPNSERFLMFDSVKSFVCFLQKYHKDCSLSKRMVNRTLEPGKTRCVSKMIIDDGELLHVKNYNIIEVLLNMNEDQFEKVA